MTATIRTVTKANQRTEVRHETERTTRRQNIEINNTPNRDALLKAEIDAAHEAYLQHESVIVYYVTEDMLENPQNSR